MVGTAASLVKVAPFIASFIRPEWSGLGPQETLELPGNSWHQWGTAVDVFAAVGASASWRGQLNLRVLYIAKGIGLRSIVWGVAGMGPKPYHLQLSQFASPIADLDGAGLSGRDVLRHKIFDDGPDSDERRLLDGNDVGGGRCDR